FSSYIFISYIYIQVRRISTSLSIFFVPFHFSRSSLPSSRSDCFPDRRSGKCDFIRSSDPSDSPSSIA
uniref:Uncharacterized protein n=1 Tax=Scophthalmus maximus TaxID=52904 RepID=A0A8D2ZU58_SCOMX